MKKYRKIKKQLFKEFSKALKKIIKNRAKQNY